MTAKLSRYAAKLGQRFSSARVNAASLACARTASGSAMPKISSVTANAKTPSVKASKRCLLTERRYAPPQPCSLFIPEYAACWR